MSGIRRRGAEFCFALLLAAMSAAPAAAQLSCRAGQQASAVVELMFGRKIGDRVGVSEAAWRRFLDREITPRFPDGLTVMDASGQWRDQATRRVVREPSKIVSIVLKEPENDQKHIAAITEAYKKRFRQQAVGVVVRPACISFQ
jgi:hypothetical protein